MTHPPAHLPDATLRRSLEAAVGHDAAARALQLAGHEAGDAIFALLGDAEWTAAKLDDLDESEFWQRLNRIFAERGWGELHFEELHAGIGALQSAEWTEADPGIPALRPSCHFTVGMIANLLGRIAGAEVGVIESECRSRGDLQCRFLFGGRTALDQVYAGILAGNTGDELLTSLG
jgi:predicted hydrocarbon binding protein